MSESRHFMYPAQVFAPPAWDRKLSEWIRVSSPTECKHFSVMEGFFMYGSIVWDGVDQDIHVTSRNKAWNRQRVLGQVESRVKALTCQSATAHMVVHFQVLEHCQNWDGKRKRVEWIIKLKQIPWGTIALKVSILIWKTIWSSDLLEQLLAQLHIEFQCISS